MKYVTVLLLVLFSCKNNKTEPGQNYYNYPEPPTESVLMLQKSLDSQKQKYDILYQQLIKFNDYDRQLSVRDSLKRSNDSLNVVNNKLGKELLHKKLIIENAKTYLNIVNKNPTQQKFLRGWMNRALNQ